MSDDFDLRGILQDSVTRLLTDLATKDVIDRAEQGVWPDRIWDALEQAGLTRTLVPEEAGGAGGTWGDALVVLKASGHFAAPVPIAETVLGAWMLAAAGIEVPDGPLTVAPVRRGETLSLAGSAVSGRATRVPWGASVAHVVAIAAGGDGRPHVALLRAGDIAAEANRSVAAEPRDTLTCDATAAVAVAPAPDGLTAERLFELGAMLRTGQMSGGIEFLLRQSVQYANERIQFGRPIGKFQALQQQLAVLAGEAAAAGMAAATAFNAAESGPARFEIAVAKARVGEAAGKAATIAHGAHGAIGFTYEHALHFVTRRLWAWRAEFGNEAYWQEMLGREAAGRGAGRLWPALTGTDA